MTTKENYLHSFVSGAIGGICAKTVIAPIERIKIIFLVNIIKDLLSRLALDHLPMLNVFKNSNMCTRSMDYQIFGEGTQPTSLELLHKQLQYYFSFLINSLKNFSTFDYLRKRFAADANNHSLNRKARLFLCGSVAGILAQTITYPFDFLRTRLAMQRDHFSYANIFHAFRSIYRDEGPRAFYSGVGIGIIGVSLYHGMGFFFFTLQKESVIKHSPHLRESKLVDFTLGGLGSLCAQIISYPFDIVKKRMQGQKVLLHTGEIKEMMQIIRTFYIFKNSGVLKMIFHVHNSEGVFRGFYKGVSLNFIKAPISSGTAWTVKNAINRRLDKKYDL